MYFFHVPFLNMSSMHLYLISHMYLYIPLMLLCIWYISYALLHMSCAHNIYTSIIPFMLVYTSTIPHMLLYTSIYTSYAHIYLICFYVPLYLLLMLLISIISLMCQYLSLSHNPMHLMSFTISYRITEYMCNACIYQMSFIYYCILIMYCINQFRRFGHQTSTVGTACTWMSPPHPLTVVYHI